MQKVGCSRVTHPFATLYTPEGALIVRLACVKHAASVHPEPGSNPPFQITAPVGLYQTKKSVLGFCLMALKSVIDRTIKRKVSFGISDSQTARC